MAFLAAYWALEDGIFFIHLDVAVDVDRVEARSDEGIGLALIAVDNSADAFILGEIMGQIHQLIADCGSFMANYAQLFFIMHFSFIFFVKDCFLLI